MIRTSDIECAAVRMSITLDGKQQKDEEREREREREREEAAR